MLAGSEYRLAVGVCRPFSETSYQLPRGPMHAWEGGAAVAFMLRRDLLQGLVAGVAVCEFLLHLFPKAELSPFHPLTNSLRLPIISTILSS